MDECYICGRDQCWGGSMCNAPKIQIDHVVEFEKLLISNMDKTRLFNCPREVTDPAHRQYLFMEYCYKESAKEAFITMMEKK